MLPILYKQITKYIGLLFFSVIDMNLKMLLESLMDTGLKCDLSFLITDKSMQLTTRLPR